MLAASARVLIVINKIMFTLPSAPGAPLTRNQVLFSWALSEAYSPRWREETMAAVGPSLKAKIARGETRDFALAEQDELIAAFSTRRGYFVDPYINQAKSFKIIPLRYDVLERVPVLPTFSLREKPMSLAEYMNGESHDDWMKDPRHAAMRCLNQPGNLPDIGYPVVAYEESLGVPVLIDGYVRCITLLWRQRRGETLPLINMIYCMRS